MRTRSRGAYRRLLFAGTAVTLLGLMLLPLRVVLSIVRFLHLERLTCADKLGHAIACFILAVLLSHCVSISSSTRKVIVVSGVIAVLAFVFEGVQAYWARPPFSWGDVWASWSGVLFFALVYALKRKMHWHKDFATAGEAVEVQS